VQRLRLAAGTGLSPKDEIDALAAFVAGAEKEWGQPVMDLAVKEQMRGGDLYAAQKALRLTRLGRTPADVVDGFIEAKGSVDGRAVAPRKLHYQRFAPIGPPSGKTVVVSPGYLETGRTFEEQIQKLNQQGHLVFAMDHQWAGQSGGKPGGIDSGFGVARDVAAMTAFAASEAAKEFGADARVLLFGNSMGAGPGAFTAAILNDAGRIQLDGPAMPKGVDVVLQAPFFGATKRLLNGILQGGARLPMVNRLQLPALGLPNITNDPRAEQLSGQDMVLEDVRSQLSAFGTARADIEAVLQEIKGGLRPQGRVSIVGNADDTLADSGKWQEVKDALGDQVRLSVTPGRDHVLSQATGDQDRAITAIQELLTS
jgi:pimeloyl-ACP methyl ester carboxylesterase